MMNITGSFCILYTDKHCVLVVLWLWFMIYEYCVLQVGTKGAGSLPCDYVLTNILDMSAIESMAVLCTSCKAKEKAVARCSDCANFLCPNCNTAHQVSWLHVNHKELNTGLLSYSWNICLNYKCVCVCVRARARAFVCLFWLRLCQSPKTAYVHSVRCDFCFHLLLYRYPHNEFAC
jgi:hypothetical protein